jgi:GTP-binding protein HflX
LEQRRRTPFDRLSPPQQGEATGRAMVVGPYLRRRTVKAGARMDAGERDPAARLEEAVGLARAIDLEVVEAGLAPLTDVRPATYLGKGKVEELAGLAKSHEVGIVIMDCALSPVQQRNLEKAFGAKVLDRTGLILEIFGRRARTREGTLQVEHAHLTYQKGRLVRSWTHLEAPARRLRLPRRPGREPRSIRPPPDRRAHRQDRARARRREAHPQAAPRQPQARAVSDRRAGRLHQCRQVDAVQPHDPRRRVAADMLFATLDPTCARSRCRMAPRRSSPTRSASSPTCRPCWSRPSARRSKRWSRPT